MQDIFAGLVASGDAHSFRILLADARPGVPEHLRLDALQALEQASHFAGNDDRHTRVNVVRAAMRDPFLSVQQAGQALSGVYNLSEFRRQIQAQAQGAPTAF